ncbi:fimbrial chaperone protein [Salmonella bongori]|nr:fimbrial chaperone protein [Salmonella bongori]
MLSTCYYKMLVSFAVGFTLLNSNIVNAAINVDRTRIVMGGEDKSLAVTLTNQSKSQPYLAQSWIDDASEKRSESYLTGATAITAY